MLLEFVPKNKEWKGKIFYKEMKYRQKIKLFIDKGIKVTSDGIVAGGDNLLEMMVKQFDILEFIIEKIELETTTGQTVTDLDELAEYKSGIEVMAEMFGLIMGGQEMGKPSRKN